MMKLIAALRNFANAPKNWLFFLYQSLWETQKNIYFPWPPVVAAHVRNRLALAVHKSGS
jgi:hypothetical protein